jgi:serine/threonine protein phosphatase PrpC
MGICFSDSPTLADSETSEVDYLSAITAAVDRPFRASIYGDMNSEAEETERMTMAIGKAEDQLKLGNCFGYKSLKGVKEEGTPNQDNFFVMQDLEFSLYGVFDGHGPHGHKVGGYVQRMLPMYLLDQPDFLTDPKPAIVKAFKKVQEDFNAQSRLSASLSGTTATIVLQTQTSLVIAHVGDSKAVVFAETNDNKFEVVLATSDHKPNRPDETKRINKLGGEVLSECKGAPYRFFQRGTTMPGLAISRCLGNTRYQSYGLSNDPEISEVAITAASSLVIIASDGVWEFMQPGYIAKLLSKVEGVQAVAECVVAKARRCWEYMDESSTDDITAVVSSLKPCLDEP